MAVPKMMRAMQIQEQGGLEVLDKLREIPVPQPGKSEVLVKVEWAGVNFIDTYQRGGIYKLPMPRILGNEAAGTVVALGEGAEGVSVGDTVACYTAGGSFAEYTAVEDRQTIKLPAGISTKDAATVLLQGLTALTIVKEAHEVKPGQFVLVQAAAGGLGQLLCQLSAHFGAHVIGTTSTAEKAEIAKKAGAKDVILYGGDVNVAEEVYKITGGEGNDRGVHAIFDGVGKDTFEMDFEIARRKASIVSIGNASGPVPPMAPLKLGPKCIKLVRPVLNGYVHTKEEYRGYASMLFDLLQSGKINISRWKEDGYEFSAEGIRQAQDDISSRKTSGKLVVKVP